MSESVQPTQPRPTRHERRRKQREFKEQQKQQGKQYPPTYTLPNRKSEHKTEDEEQEDIQKTTEKILDVYRQLLPKLLYKLARIPDPRSPKKVKHQMTIMMIYGILMFVFQMPSRRGTNHRVIKTARYTWISSDPIKKTNIHGRCNLIARKRWLQENTILKEKHQGYHYEHIFSHNWNAMKEYHYLMHIARMLNEMVLHSICLTEHVKKVGFRRFIEKFRKNMIYSSLDTKRIRKLMKSPGQLRLVQEDDWKIRTTAA